MNLEDDITLGDASDISYSSEDDEDFYTPGSQELYDARLSLLKYSISKASHRIKLQLVQPDLIENLKERRLLNEKAAKVSLQGTQLIHGNTRTISLVRYSKNGSLGCGSWDGSIYVLDEDLRTTRVYAGHSSKVTFDWGSDGSILSGGEEGDIKVWQAKETPVTSDASSDIVTSLDVSFKGHSSRITKVLYHPLGNLAISTSFDQTWKLWDLPTQKELLQQEGHSREVFCGAIHPDGGIFASGGLDGIVKVWDLRSGRLISTFDNHIQGVYSMDWSDNGYHLASGSGDCSVKIWDLRKNEQLSSIPAHTKLVSDVRFNGKVLMSSGYDGLVNLWSVDNWVRVNSLGHNDKVSSVDWNGKNFVTGGWDRAVRLWSE